LGGAIAWAGDLNGDGLSEIAVGAPHWAYEDDKEGHVFVWFGRPTGFGDVPDWWAEGNEFGGHFGTGVAGVGVNGDGYADLVVTGRLSMARPTKAWWPCLRRATDFPDGRIGHGIERARGRVGRGGGGVGRRQWGMS
jgi:hypothetical protein